MIESSRIASIVAAFIEHPADRRRFDDFFQLSFHVARGFLASLIRRGYRVPLEEYGHESGLNDCTIDCLATLLTSRPGHPFHLVVDYCAERITPDTSPDQIAALFYGLIAGHMRQELHRMKNACNPQQANLKRRIREIMGGGEYSETEEGGTRYWIWRHATQPQREDKPLIDDAALSNLTLQAIRSHPLMPDRCRAVFRGLDSDDRFRNAIPSHLFIAAMVRALTGFEDWAPQSERPPDQVYLRDQISRLADVAVQQTTESVLAPLTGRRDLSQAELDAFIAALHDLFKDISTDGDHDVLPRYVKERLEATGIEWDLKRHKYIWETAVTDCKERLRDLLRDKGLGPDDQVRGPDPRSGLA